MAPVSQALPPSMWYQPHGDARLGEKPELQPNSLPTENPFPAQTRPQLHAGGEDMVLSRGF